MSSKQLVTLVVPIYNVKKYLRRCLDSIKEQTYRNIEVVMVNDGSTDGSEIIAKEYAVNDSRFMLLNKKNGGLSSARNFGMKHAQGDFISFIDSDDFVSADYVNKLISAFDDDLDVVIADYAIFSEEEQKFYLHSGTFGNKVYSDAEEKMKLASLLFIPGSLVMPVWKNMYRSSFLKSHGIEYVSERLIYAEDFLFNLECYLTARKVVSIEEVVFFHLVIKSSLSQTYRNNYFEMQKELYIQTMKLLERYGCDNLKKQYRETRANDLAGSFLKLSNCPFHEAVNNMKKLLSDSENKNILSGRTTKDIMSRRKPVFIVAKSKNPVLIVLLCKAMICLEPIYRRKQKKRAYLLPEKV